MKGTGDDMRLTIHHLLKRLMMRARVSPSIASMTLLLTILCLNVAAQQPQTPYASGQPSDQHIRQVMEKLDRDNTLRLALERGERTYRGDGVRRKWMDEMKRQGIRQASFRIRFKWGKQDKALKITDTKYLRQYYEFDTAISEPSVHEQIRASGLEKELGDAILRRAKAVLNEDLRNMNRDQICGMLYLNLLDDEELPILDEPDEIEECAPASIN